MDTLQLFYFPVCLLFFDQLCHFRSGSHGLNRHHMPQIQKHPVRAVPFLPSLNQNVLYLIGFRVLAALNIVNIGEQQEAR